MTCRWRWKTSCPASRPLFILTAYPPSVTSNFSATALDTSKRRLTTPSGSSPISSKLATCCLGMTRRWTGVLLFMSLKASTSSSSWTTSASISPRPILQNMQLASLTACTPLKFDPILQRGQRPRHRYDTGGLAAKPVRPEPTKGYTGFLRSPQLALAPPSLWTHEEARGRTDHCLDGSKVRGVVQEHAGLPHPCDCAREPHGLRNLRHAQPERLARRGLGNPSPTVYLALARVHDAMLRQERHYARGPHLRGLLDHEVHPATLGHRLIK